MELSVGVQATDAVLLGDEEREVRLSELWANAPLMLLFLRHFG